MHTPPKKKNIDLVYRNVIVLRQLLADLKKIINLPYGD